ncbi:hypothetical protein STPYR_12992 [uncultured Stenotrophomonas sp.]|uniref:Uncharacterized protein n=1 Tax=uncultured Stenotrophomonas sp. TaxID=165438 RepID=A0A1Y5Q6W1_9GAMM|nr:hypothetical protein STPYR_12992 [uncultured Stenotrophomonas sp.]
MQVALVAAAGGQRFHLLEGQHAADGRGRGVDCGQAGAGHGHGVEGCGVGGRRRTATQHVAQAQFLAADHGHVAGREVVVAGSLDLDGVVGRGIQAIEADTAGRVGHAASGNQAVRGADLHRGAGQGLAAGVIDGDAQAAGVGQGCTCKAHPECNAQRFMPELVTQVASLHDFVTPQKGNGWSAARSCSCVTKVMPVATLSQGSASYLQINC